MSYSITQSKTCNTVGYSINVLHGKFFFEKKRTFFGFTVVF